MKLSIILITAALLVGTHGAQAAEKLKALIIDGQNNHTVRAKSTIIMRAYLQETALYNRVDIARTKFS